MKKGRIVVIGSTNMDMVVKSTHLPAPGETVLGGDFLMNPGGKGANQAVAVARLGAEVSFISKVGDDLFGKQLLQHLTSEGIDTAGMVTDQDHSTGVALITVDAAGENSIVVASGANAELFAPEVEQMLRKMEDAEIILIQLEIPMETVRLVAQYASSKGIRLILNPAPANSVVSGIFHMIDIITPNENEAEMLSGIAITDQPSARKAAEFLHEQGVKNVVITMGKSGAVLLEEGNFYSISAPLVEVVDTTAAGDAFNGALAVAIAEGKELKDAVGFACQAASLTVTKMGAQSSIPHRDELKL